MLIEPDSYYSHRYPEAKSYRFMFHLEDLDAVYGRAIGLEQAKSIVPPENKRCDERQAGFIEPGVNR